MPGSYFEGNKVAFLKLMEVIRIPSASMKITSGILDYLKTSQKSWRYPTITVCFVDVSKNRNPNKNALTLLNIQQVKVRWCKTLKQ